MNISNLLETLDTFEKKVPVREKHALGKRTVLARKFFIVIWMASALALLSFVVWSFFYDLDLDVFIASNNTARIIFKVIVSGCLIGSLGFLSIGMREFYLETRFAFSQLIMAYQRDRKNMDRLKDFSDVQIVEAKNWLGRKKSKVDSFVKKIFKLGAWVGFFSAVAKLLDIFGYSFEDLLHNFEINASVIMTAFVASALSIGLLVAILSEYMLTKKVDYKIFILDSVLNERYALG
ncbi:hypothetical protein [Kushneria indalinina]|uniref:Uncharacterized protein n=1 Tax=Kushneria indalinina DSM 14324 TaxID=1122140 RepID=A0A3D9DRU7_9GAMM|nr:hypothetical protein [Kushneria indalinina]REC93391.1 hypothetical protein C8D72_3437 [Kushneria indalinina DSM 14324]